MLPSVVPRLTTDSSVRVFPGVWKLLSFLRLPSRDGSLSLPLLSLFLSFIFFPTSFQRQWAALLHAWCPLLAFRSCFVEFAQRSNFFFFFFLWICGGESGIPILFLHHLRTAPRKLAFSSQAAGHCWVFQICWHIECSTLSSSFRILNTTAGIPSSPLVLYMVIFSLAHFTSHSRMSGSRWVTTPS